MPTIFHANDRMAIERRLRLLPEGARPVWGTFSSEQMLAHLCDALKMALGELPISSRVAPPFLKWPLVRHAIIHWLPFPKGAPTAPELLARRSDGHHREIEAVIALLDRIVRNQAHGQWAPHPAFGVLSTPVWGVLVYKHVDHHLRQFNV